MLNKIILQGRFANDLEIKYTPSNTAVISASLAVQRSRKDASGKYPTDFISCVFWGKTAETVSQFFSKGDQVLVSGRLETRQWQDKNGNKRTSYEVQVESFDFCGAKKETSQKTSVPDYAGSDDFADLGDDSDIPF